MAKAAKAQAKSTATQSKRGRADKKGKVEEAGDRLQLDESAAVKKLLQAAKERGSVTYDELNAALPPDQVSSEQIVDVMAALSEMGVNVVEADEAEEPDEAEPDDEEEGEGVAGRRSGNIDDDDIGRTDDPVRMYLREMGSVELLSREGEIAIAKRIEAGREKMIGGLMESPLTALAILDWRDALKDGGILLRDILDLDASMGASPDGAANDDEVSEDKPAVAAKSDDDAEDSDEESEEDDDEENEAVSLSLAAMERVLLPQVEETFGKVARVHKRLEKLRRGRMETIEAGDDLDQAQEKRYEKTKKEMAEALVTVRLNNQRIEQLVEQLYELNREAVALEGQVLRLAMGAGVPRES
ncbi:MAG: RNA polymerase sigma factor region1.1 domain-containing protein, partial [Alphaproteobacteria bacterium]